MERFSKITTARILGFLIVGLLATAVYVLVISPRFADTREAREQVAAAKKANAVTVQRIAKLKKQSTQLASSRPLAKRITSLFPPDADQEVLFSQIKAAGAEAGLKDIDIKSVTPSAPTFGVVTGGGGAQAAPTTPAATNGATTLQGGPANRIASHSLTISANASEAKALKFLTALENLDRAFLVNSIKFEPETDTALEVTGQMFMLPAPQNPLDPVPAAPGDVPKIPGVGPAPVPGQATSPNGPAGEGGSLDDGLVHVTK